MPNNDQRQSNWERFASFFTSERASTITAIAAAAIGLITSIGAVILVPNQGAAPPKYPHSFDYLPWVIALIGLIAVTILAVGFLAARAGIRKRERRLDLVERLLLAEATSTDDTFTRDARKIFVASLGQFAKDVVELSKKLSRREAADVVTPRHISRAAELLSMGSASRRGNYMGSIGGVLLGAGLAELFVVISDTKPSSLEIGLTFSASILGVVLLAYQWFSA